MVAASSAYGYRRARPAALRGLLCVAAARAPQQGSTVQMGPAYSSNPCGRPPLVRPTHLLAQDCPLGPGGEPLGSALRLAAWIPTGGCGGTLVPETQGCRFHCVPSSRQDAAA